MNGAAILSDKQLGDVLLLEPSARHLAHITGQSCALYVNEAFQPLIELMPGATWGPATGGRHEHLWVTSKSSRALLRSLRLRAARRTLIVSKSEQVRWWHRLIFRHIQTVVPGTEYWSRYFWRLISGQPAENFSPPALSRPPDDWRHPNLPTGPFLLINPTAAWQRKFWPAEKWIEILRRWQSTQSLPIVLTGGTSPKETQHCQDILDAGLPIINLAGQTSLKHYLQALSAASLVVCIDGSASHLAQAFDVPTLTIFGPTHDQKWHWPTPRHRALASRQFTQPPTLGPASHVPVEAVWETLQQLPLQTRSS